MLIRKWATAGDRELVDALVAAGDESAFRTLYERHTPILYRVALRIVNEEQEAEDVVQETWLRAVRALHTFRWGSSLATWLCAIAINRAREMLRGRRHMESDASIDELPGDEPNWGEQIDLQRALDALPEGYRSVYELYDVQGYTHDEIASRLGIAPGTSKSQLFHARRRLRAFLEPLMAGGLA